MEQPSLDSSAPAPTTNKMAIASLTLIIIGFVAAFFAWVSFSGGTGELGTHLQGPAILTPFLAIIFGHIARRQIREAKGRERGKGMALAGLILGYCSILGPIAFIICVIIAFG